MNVPLIETERLRLRAHRPSDLEDCVAMWSDPGVTRWISGKPSSEQQTWARLLNYAGHWQLLRYGYWVAERKENGEFVGEVGFADFKRAIAPAMRDVPEIGFALATKFHGQGYGREAVSAVLAWADDNLASPRTVCMIAPENERSIHVVERFGYRRFAAAAYNDVPVLFFERMKPVAVE